VGQRGLEVGAAEPTGGEGQGGRVVEVGHAASWIGAAAGGNGGRRAVAWVECRRRRRPAGGLRRRLPAARLAPEPAVLGPAARGGGGARAVRPAPRSTPIALAGYLGRRCPPGGAVLDHLEALDGEELALAWACADGASAAIARFEARYFGELRVGVARLGLTADELAEVTQEVRRMLFADAAAAAPRADRPRRAARAPPPDGGAGRDQRAPTGRSRAAGRRRRRSARAPRRRAVAERPGGAGPAPRGAARRAGGGAGRAVTPRPHDPRLHALDGVSLAALATMHRVDRATISRWIAAAREQIYRETRRALTAQRGVAAVDFDSFVDVLRSRFELSLRDALADRSAP
jgi:hypothetical protein